MELQSKPGGEQVRRREVAGVELLDRHCKHVRSDVHVFEGIRIHLARG